MTDAEEDAVAHLDASWRELCQADPLASRGRQPAPDSDLPRVLIAVVTEVNADMDAFVQAVALAATDRYTAAEALRHISLLGDAYGRTLTGDAELLRRLVTCLGRAHEATAGG